MSLEHYRKLLESNNLSPTQRVVFQKKYEKLKLLSKLNLDKQFWDSVMN